MKPEATGPNLDGHYCPLEATLSAFGIAKNPIATLKPTEASE